MGELSRKLEEVLPAYIDHEISDPAEREVIAEQIEQDPELQESIQELRNVGFWLHEYYAAVGRAPAPEGERPPKPMSSAELAVDEGEPGKRWGSIGESSAPSSAAWGAMKAADDKAASKVSDGALEETPAKTPSSPLKKPVSDDLAELVGRELGGYRIVSEIARGGMGTVFKAIQLSMDRPVALKVLAPRLQGDKAFVRRFAREARSAAQIDHPNIVRIYDVGRAEEYSFFSMELIDGRDLKEVLTEKGCIEPEEACGYAIQACQALEAAQAQGVVHRDIKPANMLICATTETVKIADMGLAKETSSADGSITMDRTVMGSPNYMAPEQAEDIRKTDHQTDVYGLGASLLHMLTGKVPFGRGKPVEVIARVLTQKLPIPETVHGKNLDPALKRILRKAMAKSRAERYTDAASLRQDLEAYLAGGARRPRPGTDSAIATRAAKGSARHRGAGKAVGKSARSHRKLEAARPSTLLMLLSGLAGFLIVGLFARALIPSSEPANTGEVAVNQPNTPRPPTAEERRRMIAEEAARQKEERERRERSFKDLSQKLQSGTGDYAVTLAEIKKLELEADGVLVDTIAAFLEEESKIQDKVGEVLKELDKAKVLEAIRQRREAVAALKDKVAYHPAAERLDSGLELLAAAEARWVERRRGLVQELLAKGQFSQAEESAREARQLLAKAGGLESTQGGLVDLFALIEEQRAAKNEALAQAVARESLKSFLRESYTVLRGASLAQFRERIAALNTERDKKDNARIKDDLAKHVSELGLASSVLEDAVARIARLKGYQDFQLEDGRRIKGILTKTGDDRFALKVKDEFSAFQAHQLSTAELIVQAREGRGPDPRSEAVFSVYRGEFKRARKRLADARAEAPGILPGFDERLASYSELEAELLLAALGDFEDRDPKRSDRLALGKLLDDDELGLTRAVAARKDALRTWSKGEDAGEEEDEAVVAAAIPEPQGDPDPKIARLFKAPVVGKGLIAVTYAFEDEEEREDFGKRRIFADNKRTNDFLNKYVVKAKRPPIYRNRGYEAWQVRDKQLWGRGWERCFTKAKWAPGYLRIEAQAMAYNGKNVVIAFGQREGREGRRTLMVSPALALPKRVVPPRGRGGNNGGGGFAKAMQRYLKAWDERTRPARLVAWRNDAPPNEWDTVDRRDLRKIRPALIGLRIQIFPRAEYEALVKAGKLKKKFRGEQDWVLLITTKLGRKSSTQNPIGLDRFPAGSVGFQTFGEFVSFSQVRIVGSLDQAWVKERGKDD